MKLARIVIAGVLVTLFDAVVGMVTCGWIFNWVYHLEPTSVWKAGALDAPPGVLYYAGSILLSIALAFVYALLRRGIPGKTQLVRGLVFGLCVWVVGMLPGMFALHYFTSIAATVILYWTLIGLVQSPLRGLIIAAVYGE